MQHRRFESLSFAKLNYSLIIMFLVSTIESIVEITIVLFTM